VDGFGLLIGSVLCAKLAPVMQKKPARLMPQLASTTPAYSLTGLPAQPRCPLFSLPTTNLNYPGRMLQAEAVKGKHNSKDDTIARKKRKKSADSLNIFALLLAIHGLAEGPYSSSYQTRADNRLAIPMSAAYDYLWS
jgi:hypothetical protein